MYIYMYRTERFASTITSQLTNSTSNFNKTNKCSMALTLRYNTCYLCSSTEIFSRKREGRYMIKGFLLDQSSIPNLSTVADVYVHTTSFQVCGFTGDLFATSFRILHIK